MTSSDIALPKNLRDIVDEYDQKVTAAADAVRAFESAAARFARIPSKRPAQRRAGPR